MIQIKTSNETNQIIAIGQNTLTHNQLPRFLDTNSG